jgi:hypothetical protein
VEEYVVPLIAHLLEDGHVQESILDSVPQLTGSEMGARIKEQVPALIKLPLPVTKIKAQVRPPAFSLPHGRLAMHAGCVMAAEA